MVSYTVFYDSGKTEVFDQEIRPLLAEIDCDFVAFDTQSLPELAEQTRVMVWLGDNDLYSFIPVASERLWWVGFLPHPDMNRAYRSYNIPQKPADAIADIVASEAPVCSDLMYCNGQLVLSSVMLGNPVTMIPAARVDESIWSKLTQLVVLTFNLSKTCLLPYKIETAKESVVSTAALGIAAVYRPSNSSFTKRVVGETTEDEASLNAVILAPRSISEVVHFILTRVLPKTVRNASLSDYLGHIKTTSMTITSQGNIDYSVDGNVSIADRIDISVQSDALQVLSSCLPTKLDISEHKESIRVTGLPKGQAVNEVINRPLHWIHHTDQEEVKETFVTLKENARISESYLVLMILATLLATFGLFANSAPVIIGAMILAPLMSPIISLSMGVLRQNGDLISVSAKTLFTGVLLALFCGTILTLLTPLNTINHEIGARLSPTILDLGIAIISGIAGAYASARSEVAKSLAGVAIAVALVPPLAVSGIGIGWMDLDVFWGAFLLFMTNLVGIILAASATFLFMGFSPFHLAKKGILLSLAFVVLVSMPLVLAFDKMVEEQGVVYALEGWETEGVEVKDVKIRTGDPMYVSVKLLSDTPLKGEQISEVKQRIETRLGQNIRLEATVAVVR